ncbi:MAG: 50S ribosomal protein L30 [Chloroflexi bacterium]|nr:50S ribosomal protein L30 [Chloroflexota bacterium]
MAKKLRITWVKSSIGYTARQKVTINTLGLRRLNQSVEHYDTPVLRGMLDRVEHLLNIEVIEG